MDNLKDLIADHLAAANVMQLATSVSDQPWVCTVHYYADDEMNLYWISTRERQHSQMIDQNPKVAAAIMVHENTPEEKYIIGISIEGTAECIGEQPDQQISDSYRDKLHKDPKLIADISSGQNPHKFYRLIPSKIVVLDTKNLSGNPRQEWVKGTGNE